MSSVITFDGKVRILELVLNDITHIGFAGPTPSWSDEFNPPLPDENASSISQLLGYAKVNEIGWMVSDEEGDILIDGQSYSISEEPSTIGYIKATLPSGTLEGVNNRISKIGAFGNGVLTNPADLTFATPAQIVNSGSLFRLRHEAVYVKPSNTKAEWYILFPLVS